MAKNWVSQGVYDAMKGIASDKNEYEYLDSVGATTERDAYGKAAIPKYDVVKAYSPELAAQIKGMNSVSARNLLSEYGVARDSKTIANEIISNKFGYEDTKAKGGDYKPYETASVALYDELRAVDPATANLLKNMSYNQAVEWQNTGKMPTPVVNTPKVRSVWDVANDIIGYKQGYEGGKKVGVEGYEQNHVDAQPFYAELEGMGEEGKAMAARLRGMNAAEATAYITANRPVTPKTPEQLTAERDAFMQGQGQRGLDTIQDMYTNPAYGQNIRDKFTAYGGAMGSQAAAKAASDNGGNFDSFSEYNKNATNLAYQLAGENVIQNMRSGYASDYFTKGLIPMSDVLNQNSADYYDYVNIQNDISSKEKQAQWANDTQRYAYDTEAASNKYEIDKQYELDMAKLEAEKAASDAQMRMNGYNPDGTPLVSNNTPNSPGSDLFSVLTKGNGDGLSGLGLDPNVYSQGLLEKLKKAGAIHEENGVVKWSDGWSAENYEQKLEEAEKEGSDDAPPPGVEGEEEGSDDVNGDDDNGYEDSSLVDESVFDLIQTVRDNITDFGSNEEHAFIDNVFLPYIQKIYIGEIAEVTEAEIQKMIVDNASKYSIKTETAKALCDALNIDSTWTYQYGNSGQTEFNWYMKKKQSEQ